MEQSDLRPQSSEIERLYAELEAAISQLTFRVPQPGGIEFLNRCVDLAKKLRALGETTNTIHEHLSCAPEDVELDKFQALVACLLFRIDRKAYPWERMIDVCSRGWSDWGYPYVTAAREVLKEAKGADNHQVDLRVAQELLEKANHRVSVTELLFMRTLEELFRPLCNSTQGNELVFAMRWLALHRPIASNLSSWADAARKANDNEAMAEALCTSLRVLGRDPSAWNIEKDFLDLSSAGSLCIHIGQTRLHDVPDFDWNQHAIEYFEASLLSDDADGARLYSRIRLVGQYAHRLTAQATQLDDDVFDATYEKARRAAVELTTLVKGEERDLLYQASRDLAKIIAAAVRRARNRGDDAQEVSRLIEMAHSHYRSWIQFAVEEKRWAAKNSARNFLLENLEYPVAVELLSKDTSAFSTIAAKVASGRRKEAVKELLAALDGESDPEFLVRCAWLLHQYIGLLARDQINVLRASIPRRAIGALRQLIPLLIEDCSRSIGSNDFERAKRSLAAAVSGDASEPTVIHLRARIGLREGDYSSVANDLAALLRSRPALRSNEYIVAAFHTALRRSMAPVLDCNDARRLIEVQKPDAKIKAEIDLLLWELRTNQLTDWPARLQRAIRRHQDSSEFQRLPAAAFKNVPQHAVHLVNDVLYCIGAQDGNLEWCSEMLSNLPAKYFTFEDAARSVVAVLGANPTRAPRARVELVNALGDGMSRALIHMWRPNIADLEKFLQGNGRTLGRRADRIRCWTQILGGNRHVFESVVAKREYAEICNLVGSFEDVRQPEAWVEKIESALERLKNRTVIPSQAPSWLDNSSIAHHCAEAVRTFRPDRPDPDFWANLKCIIDHQFPPSLSLDDEVQLVARIWLHVHSEIESLMIRRLLPVLVGAVHGFKNDLLYRLPREEPEASEVPPRWHDQLGKVLDRTRRLVGLHRWPRLRPVDLCKVLEEAAYQPPFTRTLKNAPQGPRLWVTRPDDPLIVLGDFDLLVEATMELMINSLMHVEEQGEGGWLWVASIRESTSAVIRVTSSGGGCPPAVLASMNDPNSYAMTEESRTGLGLPICHRIAESHEGKLSFRFDDAVDHGVVAELRLSLG